MGVNIYIAVLTLILAALWWGARYIAVGIGKLLQKSIRNDAQSGFWNRFIVFSAQSSDNTEAEFIYERLFDVKKIAWSFRALIVSVYVILIWLIVLKR